MRGPPAEVSLRGVCLGPQQTGCSRDYICLVKVVNGLARVAYISGTQKFTAGDVVRNGRRCSAMARRRTSG